MSPDSKDFKKLQAKWRKKLEDSGFEDIEDEQERFRPSFDIFRNRPDEEWISSKIEYYRRAGQFLHHYPFEDKVEELVWRLHSEAVGVRKIAEVLNSIGVTKKKKDIVHQIIKKLAKIMVKNVY